MTLGEKIQLSRKKKGMSQEDLANLLNVSRQAVQKWESDSSIPEVEKLVLISNCFDVSLDWLLKDVPAEKQEATSQQPESISCEEEETRLATNNTQKEKGISYAAIKGWMIVGIILTPLSIGGSVLNATNYSLYSLLFLLLYLITIPLGIHFLRKVKNAHSKSEVIKYGVLSLIFISTI